jgi:plastocyanin
MVGLGNFVRIGVLGAGLALVAGLFAFWGANAGSGHTAHHSGAGSDLHNQPFIESPDPINTNSPRTVVNVTVQNFEFAPADVEIPAGSSIHWTWASAGVGHSVTSGVCNPECSFDGVFNSNIKTSGTYDFTFNQPGTYPYYCVVHGVTMTGSITVDQNTAAGVTVGGRVMDSGGRGIRQAVVALTDQQGNARHVITDRLGFYSFSDVEPGTYIINAMQRRYQFEPRVESVTDSVSNIDFTASGEPRTRKRERVIVMPNATSVKDN